MAAAIPRPSRPSYGPPTTSLPAIPTTKTRKSTGAIPTTADSQIALQTPLPKSGLRTPSSTHTPPITPLPTTSLPKVRTVPGVNAAGKTIRKTISVNAFPAPPRSGVRTTSLPPSPLSAGVLPLPANASSSNLADRRDSTDASPVSAGNQKLRRRTKQSISPGSTNYVGNSTPSLLNGSGDSKSISSGAGARGSDGLLSLPSPPQSRSSSAQDSYSTSGTNYDDVTEGARGRQSSAEAANDRRSSKAPEGKGNVIVSVRVRPDAPGNGERSKTDGEWMVDGRRALVAYRGREGGDYYYGKLFLSAMT
jgi:centromeric protein E